LDNQVVVVPGHQVVIVVVWVADVVEVIVKMEVRSSRLFFYRKKKTLLKTII
jgi:hypothetical protein